MNLSHHLQSIRCTRSLLDSETIRDLELRFRNYHSETIPRGKILSAIIGRDSETTIGKLLGAIPELRLGNYFVRFRNYVWKLLGAIQELRLGNYFVRFRNYVWKLFRVIQKLRFGNYHVRFRNYGSKIMDTLHTYIFHFKIATASAMYIHFHADREPCS